ncbi:TonB-dependent receptor [Ravibacter arvi]|uniref:TonB-dependent receptor n=1 Tax=Ravibacter arvi TaxID=2051041 RepID=A0ABP8LVR5_9BACT
MRFPLFLLLAILLSAGAVSAQYSAIRGKVLDEGSSEGVIGASVLIEGTSHGIATDLEGGFQLANVLPGNYTLIVSSVGYQSQKVLDVKVQSDQAVTLEIKLKETVEMMEAVVVRAARTTNTQNAVVSEIRNAAQVVSGVSQQQIKISQDRDAAQVMSRIPGVTVVDGRFVMVRGIPERYNQVMLNNAIAPSTEIDRRTFSFDLIPSSVLDRMLVYKSGAAENPGDFAGGLIKVFTNNAAEDNFLSVTVSGGYRAGTTMHPFLQSKGSKTDFLGFDNGFRKLPSAFPSTNLRDLPNSSPVRTQAAHSLRNNFVANQTNASPDLGVGLSFGRFWQLGSARLSTLTSVNLSQSFQTSQREFYRYLEQSDLSVPVEKRFAYIDSYYEKENKLGILSNWNLNLNAYNKIAFKNLFNQIGENLTIIRAGEDFIQQAGLPRKNYLYEYRSRSIYSGQLEGTHLFPAGSSSINWVLGLNYLAENQPDLRRFRTIRNAPAGMEVDGNEYRMVTPPSSNLYDTGRYFGKLSEIGGSHGLNYEKKIGGTEAKAIKLKAGYLVDYRSRDFSTRYFSYLIPGTVPVEQQEKLVNLPLNQIFSNANVTDQNGFRIEEGTRASDSYTASNFMGAAYAGITLPLNALNLSAGVRGEYNALQLKSSSETGSPVNVDNTKFSPLGFLNADYELNKSHKVRFAYNRTLNRPEFREIAPFLFYDYEFDSERIGNPNLKVASIDNFDLRYEFYPREGEVISLGGFYKHFTNPIETLILIRSESPGFSYQNAGKAYNYGAELEVRKSLEGITGSAFLNRLSANLNASLIYSRVDYGKNASAGQEQKRALQGQSPYIVNAIVNYLDEDTGWQIGASYNIFGKRIFAVGSSMFPTIYELPRHSVDLTVSKNFRNNLSLKAGIQDLLNMRYKFYQDTDRNAKIESGRDHPIFNYRRGSLVNISLTYTIK